MIHTSQTQTEIIMANRNESYANEQMANSFAAHQDEKARWVQALGQPKHRATSKPDTVTQHAFMAAAALVLCAAVFLACAAVVLL